MQAACALNVGETWGAAVLAAIQPSYHPPNLHLLNRVSQWDRNEVHQHV